MSDELDESYEPDGLTLGPEERLEREIARSKALKVERLQLRDRISRLEEENARLKNQLGNGEKASDDASPPNLRPRPTSPLDKKSSFQITITLVFLFLITGYFGLSWLAE